MGQTVSISFFRFGSLRHRLWALWMMGAARLSLSRLPDLGFWKLCGSGTGEGFTPLPNTAVYAVIATWPNESVARARILESRVFERYRTKAAETWTVFLAPLSSRGEWSGSQPFVPAGADQASEKDERHRPMAALTRATIRPSILMRFWRRVPDISSAIGQDRNVAFKIGLGEVPWLHQVTFSIWPDALKMAQFARTGAHAEAIQAVRSEGWFREELYARFEVTSDVGTWDGSSPLEVLK
ncbi:spheroidene monooxygenase [Aestuariibius insulae]|uniref:spheroidene monooxygenase n=1 Tax=Aestuariibius insulae TaxID=2058287 RepID=UPI00345E9219